MTITYGEHTSAHFALYYGFVPVPNPFDAIPVTLADVLSLVPSSELPPTPKVGWQAAMEAALPDGTIVDYTKVGQVVTSYRRRLPRYNSAALPRQPTSDKFCTH